jgi:membrane-associated phospholipid phosphatase
VRRLRSSESLLLAYFAYVAVIAPFFIHDAWRTWTLAAVVAAAVWALSRTKGHLRDWMPLAATLAAYREMDWFAPAVHDHHLEKVWILWDRWLLDQAHLRSTIESLGLVLPAYFELCYLLVYGVAPVALGILLDKGRRDQVNRLWLAYLAATLGSYALFPYFPSEPPRTAFSGMDPPQVTTVLRQLNLMIVGGYGIHSSVFPSAHVSSAFAAAWGLLATLPQRRRIGWGMAIYALSVAIATIYGRYHYAVDAAAGFAMSFVGLAVMRFLGTSRTSSS